ncbi:MAG: signal peptidase II, partial [Clostridia bacterium]
IDLLSKQFVFAFLKTQNGGHYEVLKGIFDFVMVKNTGASFGIFDGKQTALIVITSIAMVLLLFLLYWKKDTPTTFRIGLILIFAGGLGNLVDRIALDYVRDFIDYTFLYTFFKIDFAIGNVADIFCCVGVLMLIIYIIFEFDEKDFSRNSATKANGNSDENASLEMTTDNNIEEIVDNINKIHNDNSQVATANNNDDCDCNKVEIVNSVDETIVEKATNNKDCDCNKKDKR